MSAKNPCAFRDMTCLLSTVLQKAKKNPLLDGVLESRVKRVHVEFSPGANQSKPHVVLRLLLHGGPVNLQDGSYESAGSCMFDSNNRQLVDGLDPGVVFRVHKVFKGQTWEMHKDSIIAFIYEVNSLHTVKEFVKIILGKDGGLPDGHKSNLSLFELTSVDENTLDGCRDVVLVYPNKSQWVIRLHRMGFMNWVADRAMLDDKVEGANFPLEFHNFIARDFKDVRSKLNAILKVEMIGENIGMRFGRFQDLTVERIIKYGDFPLPYVFPSATKTKIREDCVIVPSPSTAMD